MTSTPEQGASKRENLLYGFRALRIRNYRLYWLGQLISFTGRWMQTTAQSWLVIELTHSPLAIGLVTTFQFLPMMLLSLFGGVIADRMPKYRLILVMQVASLLQGAVFGLLVMLNMISIESVYILAFLQGLINAIDNPVRQTFVGDLVGREQLPNAVALNSMQFNTARIIGPAAAGLVVAKFGVAPALFINAIGFAIALVLMFLLDRNQMGNTSKKRAGSPWQQLTEGLSYAWHTPLILLVLLVVAAIGTFGYNFSVVLPLLAGFTLKTDAAGLGVLSAWLGVGSLLGAIGTTYARSITIPRLLIASAAFSVLLGITALVTNFLLACVLLAIMGLFGVTFATTANTLLQTRVPDELRGRVLSLYMLLFIGSTPLGAFLVGTISDRFGTQSALLLCSVLCIIGVAGASLYWQRRVRAIETDEVTG